MAVVAAGFIALVLPANVSYRSNMLMHAPAERIWKVLNAPGAQKKWFRSEEGSVYLEDLTLAGEQQENHLGTTRYLRLHGVGEWTEKVTCYEFEKRLELSAYETGPFKNWIFTIDLLPADQNTVRVSIGFDARLRGLSNKLWHRRKMAERLKSLMRYSLLGIKALAGG